MLYPNLKFKPRRARPVFFSNFVATLDGKVGVRGPKSSAYWPLGSKEDYRTLLQLRGHADALIHGKTTAISFPTVETLHAKKIQLLYIVISASPDLRLLRSLRNPYGIRPLLLTTLAAQLPRGTAKILDVIRFGRREVDLRALSRYLFARGIRRVLLEGGPNTFSSFLRAGLVDEVFLTLAPKMIGGGAGETVTMAEGGLLPARKIKTFRLVSAYPRGNEVFLRYRVIT